ncbi:solute carrier family 45 member 3-like [Tachypleus tridentatus]|uniref:solute carrier family 45 member 3-like n=1 Tax=Tachypleus tridentatus TaxID=6853 RepID=UPI003FD5B81E
MAQGFPIHDEKKFSYVSQDSCQEGSTKLEALKTLLSNWLHLIGINLLSLGLDLCASGGFTYIPPLMLKNGFSERWMTFTLGVGPFISLFLVPFLGKQSDYCQSGWGRRRPFILALSVLMLLSLIFIPFCHELSLYAFSGASWGAAAFLAVGVVLLDFTSQALMNPCRVLVLDILTLTGDQNLGCTIYSCMLNIGGCLGYFITTLNWGSTQLGLVMGSQEKAVFSLMIVLFSVFLIINLTLAKEVPYCPTNRDLSTSEKQKSFPIILETCIIKKTSAVQTREKSVKLHQCDQHSNSSDKTCLTNGKVHQCRSTCLETATFFSSISLHRISRVTLLCCIKLTQVFSLCLVALYHIGWVISLLLQLFFSPFFQLKGYLRMPSSLLRLFLVSLIGWMGIMCHDMFYTDFVGQVIYHGTPTEDDGGTRRLLYDEGVRMGSWGLLFHCITAVLYAALLQDKLIGRFGPRTVFILGMMCFTISMIVTVLTESIVLVNICSGISGVGLAALTTIPYSLLDMYHSKKEYHEESSSNGVRGLGEDVAYLDAAYYLSQIVLSVVMGYTVYLTGSAAAYMVVAALCGILSCYTATLVVCPSSNLDSWNLNDCSLTKV